MKLKNVNITITIEEMEIEESEKINNENLFPDFQSVISTRPPVISTKPPEDTYEIRSAAEKTPVNCPIVLCVTKAFFSARKSSNIFDEFKGYILDVLKMQKESYRYALWIKIPGSEFTLVRSESELAALKETDFKKLSV